MSKIYHVLNDYSLEPLTTKEEADFPFKADHLREHSGKVKGSPAKCYRNACGDLVYIWIDSWEDMNGYELQAAH